MSEPLTAMDREAYQAKVGVLGPFVDEALARYEVTLQQIESALQHQIGDDLAVIHNLESKNSALEARNDELVALTFAANEGEGKARVALARSQQDNADLRKMLVESLNYNKGFRSYLQSANPTHPVFGFITRAEAALTPTLPAHEVCDICNDRGGFRTENGIAVEPMDCPVCGHPYVPAAAQEAHEHRWVVGVSKSGGDVPLWVPQMYGGAVIPVGVFCRDCEEPATTETACEICHGKGCPMCYGTGKQPEHREAV